MSNEEQNKPTDTEVQRPGEPIGPGREPAPARSSGEVEEESTATEHPAKELVRDVEEDEE